MTRSSVVLPEPFGPEHVDALPRRGFERDVRKHPSLATPDLDASYGNS